jgi:malate dehydrogenase (oxaloacetate-decarboxylating)
MLKMENDSDIKEKSLDAHKKHKGKIEISGKVSLTSTDDLSIYYTPGVAQVSLAIKDDKNLSYEYTNRANTIAIITDGSRVLGLGDIGPEAEMPVIEGKSLLFKKFGGVDAIPLAIKSQSEEDTIKFVKMLEPSVAAINIEDIKSPKVFSITKRLKNELSIPMFHDDRDGTAIVARAALVNALKIVGKKFNSIKIVINGAGSAGEGIAGILSASRVNDIIICDTHGAIYQDRSSDMNEFKTELAKHTNKNGVRGSLVDVVKGADVLIGVSSKGAFTQDMIKLMNDKPIVFALANPYPEIEYPDAKAANAAIVATGRSDTPNQVNNYLAFPGFFRGILSSRATQVTNDMIIAASDAIASYVKKSELSEEYIIPRFSSTKEYINMTVKVAIAVSDAASKSGVAKIKIEKEEMKRSIKELLQRYAKIEKNLEKLNKKYK